MKEVFISKVTGDPTKNISWLLERSQIPKNLNNICIKPNLNDYRKWETASTCDPYILDALLKLLREQYPNSKITILENDATGTNADNIFAFLGVDIVAKKYECKICNAAKEEWISTSIDGYYFKKLDIPEIVTRCDFFITFPKLKSHLKTKITCALKNQMGLFRPKRKIDYHDILDELIVDCNLAMRPTLCLIDGNLAMEGNYGPSYGSPRRLGLLISSSDIVAADSFCAKLFGINPRSVGHIKKASQKGIGSMKFKLIPDFDFNKNDYRLRYSPILFWLFKKISGRLNS